MRPALRWPLYSPRRFLGVLLGALVLVVVIGHASGGGHKAHAATRPVTTTTTTTVPARITPRITPASTTTTTVPSTTTTTVAPEDVSTINPDALTVAREFVTDWSQRTLPAKTWRKHLVPFATPTVLSTTTEVDVPPGIRVTGKPTGGGDSGGGSVTVPTSHGALDLIVTCASVCRVSAFEE